MKLRLLPQTNHCMSNSLIYFFKVLQRLEAGACDPFELQLSIIMSPTVENLRVFFDANRAWLEPFLDGSIEQFPLLAALPNTKTCVPPNVQKYKDLKCQFPDEILMGIQQELVRAMKDGPLSHPDRAEMVMMALDFFSYLFSIQDVKFQQGTVCNTSQ